jgi:hypothetical protein
MLLMGYVVEMDSVAMIYIPSFLKVGSDIQKYTDSKVIS